MGYCWAIFIGIYVLINTSFALWAYFKMKKFYEPKFVEETQDDGSVKMIDLHKKYEAFRKTDKLSILRILIGTNLFFLPKLISLGITISLLILVLALFGKKLEKNRKLFEKVFCIFSGLVMMLIGARRIIKRKTDEKIYKRYFGENYKFTYDDNYSLLISNHTSWLDIMCHLHGYVCGFISKDEVKNIPLIGKVAQQIHCLFVKREDAENRHLILDQIQQRQRDFLDGKVTGPLLVFPEGTVTSGKHIMRFKKGAFNSLLPVKPLIINSLLNPNFHLSTGSAGLFPHCIYTLSFLWNNVEITELPVMTPNEHMFNYYRQKHPELKEDWEVYAEVAREIMCEYSEMEKSENSLRDSFEYSGLVLGRKKSEKHTTKGTEEKLVESNTTNVKI